MRSSYRHFDGPAQPVLALHFGKIAAHLPCGGGLGRMGGKTGGLRRQGGFSGKKPKRLVERPNRENGQAFHQSRLSGRVGWDQQAALAEMAGQERDGQRAPQRAGGAGKTELTGHQIIGEVVDRELAGRLENPKGDGQIVDRALLAQITRREIDGRAGARHVKAAVAER
jgi:hypothetical protein